MPYLSHPFPLSFASWRWLAALLMAMALSVVTMLSLRAADGAVLTASSGASAPTSASAPAVGPALERMAARSPERRVEVIVQVERGIAAAAARGLVARAGGRVTATLGIINGLGAELSAAQAARLARDPSVSAVSLNAAVESSDDYNADGADDDGYGNEDANSATAAYRYRSSELKTSFNQSIRSPALWNQDAETATGKGVGVAVVDTGIAGQLEDFEDARGESRVIASAVVHPDATSAADGYGHGTHVAGLIAGNGFHRGGLDPLDNAYAGSAPDANLISVKVSDDLGETTLIDVIHGLQFVVDHKDDYNIRVVNLSLNSTVAESYKTDPLDAAVEQAWLKGIVVVTAAGNRGTDPDAVNYAPANDPYVISVGGVDDKGTKNVSDDLLADWSSRGTTQDGIAKPDVLAPGAHMVSTLAPGSQFPALCPTCLVDGSYFRVGGTSMSAGVASGVAATLIESHPNWTPDQVKGALMNRMRNVPGAGGEVAADKADKAARGTGEDLLSNQGLTPNELIDPTTGSIDFERARWTRARWTEAAEPLRARWTRARWTSFTCDCWDAGTEVAPEEATDTADGIEAVDATRARWTRARWTRARWTRARWTMSFTK